MLGLSQIWPPIRSGLGLDERKDSLEELLAQSRASASRTNRAMTLKRLYRLMALLIAIDLIDALAEGCETVAGARGQARGEKYAYKD